MTDKQMEHIPATGPMAFIPWSNAGGWRFCSCGNWHWQAARRAQVDKMAAAPSTAQKDGGME